MKQTQVSIPKSGILNVALQPEAMNPMRNVVTGYGVTSHVLPLPVPPTLYGLTY